MPSDHNHLLVLFNQIKTNKLLPKYLSSDHDPLFKFYRWQANLRILDIEEIKTVPYAPMSHPFIERLIGTIRRECLDKTLFWNEQDLMRKLDSFKDYYNTSRGHSSLNSMSPDRKANKSDDNIISIEKYRWKKHAGGLYQLPMAA